MARQIMNIIEQFEKDQIKSLVKGKKLPQFHPGDTVRVNVKVREGTRERVQGFEGKRENLRPHQNCSAL